MPNTAARIAISARRNELARFTIAVTGIDLTGVAMAMQVRPTVDNPVLLFALGTVNTIAAEGLKLDSVRVTNGVPTSIIKGRINASTMLDKDKVPYVGEIGTDSVLAYAMQWTLNGDPQTRLYGDFIVIGSAFGSDNAPTNRPAGYGATSTAGGSSGGSLTFGDQVVSVIISDADVIGRLVDVATNSEMEAKQYAQAAANAADRVSGLADKTNAAYAALQRTTIANLGKSGTPINGDASGDQTWAEFDPVPACGPGSDIGGIEVFARAAGPLTVRVFDLVDNTLTAAAEVTVMMVQGLNTFAATDFAGIGVKAGQYIGWYASDRVALINTFGADKYFNGPYLQNSTTFTRSNPLTNYTFQIRFTLRLKTLIDLSSLGGGADRSGGVFRYKISLLISTGQSLSQGSTPVYSITTVQEFDNIGLPAKTANPTAFLPLTTGNCGVPGRGEAPIFGTLGHTKELILEENGLTYQVNDFVLAGVTNGQDGGAFSTIKKGTVPYNNGLSQVEAGKVIAAGATFGVPATLLTHGETDELNGMLTSVYAGELKQFADDSAADIRQRTGQYRDPILLLGQMNSQYTRQIPLAQLQAANEHPLIYLAGPSYQFSYGDSQHRDSEGQKNYGGLLGLVFKRIDVDGVAWEPLQPVSHSIFGNAIDVVFNKDGLTIDTALMPAQENYGFTLAGANGAKIDGAIANVQRIDSRRIRITLSNAPTLGQKLRYGFDTMTGRTDAFIGGGGNVRDNQGDRIKYRGLPVHNWLVVFERPL